MTGLITDSCESDYRHGNTIESVNNCCRNNHLNLNVKKRKKLFLIFGGISQRYLVSVLIEMKWKL